MVLGQDVFAAVCGCCPSPQRQNQDDVERSSLGRQGQCWRASRAQVLLFVIHESRPDNFVALNFSSPTLLGLRMESKVKKTLSHKIMTVRSLPFEGPRDKRKFLRDRLSLCFACFYQGFSFLYCSSSLVVLLLVNLF